MPLFLIASRLFRNLGRYRVMALVATALLIVVVGGILFALTQHISLGLGLYWSVTTATTVGYGDITPHNTAGRIVAAGVMLTTIPIVGAVFALVAGASVLSRVRRLLGMETRLLPESFTAVYGTHPVLSHVLQELSRSGDPVLLVAPHEPVDLPESFHFIAGDPTDEAVIRKSRPTNANRALIACEADADTLVVAVAIHAAAPDLEVYALTQSPRVAQALSDLGITHTLAANELVAHTLAKSLEAPQAGDVLLQLINTAEYRLVETPIGEELVSQRLSEARGRSGALVLGLCRSGTVELGLGEDPVLRAGDQLLVMQRAER